MRLMLSKLPAWPAIVLHELTHAAAAAPFAETRIQWFGAVPHAEHHWQTDTPRVAVRIAHLAPTIVGVICTLTTAAVAVPVIYEGLPANPFHAAAIALLLAYNWILYCWPSVTDRRPFSAGTAGDGSGGAA